MTSPSMTGTPDKGLADGGYMDADEFPKVLIVCPVPIYGQAGGGVAMSGFFRRWPKDRIAQIYTHDKTQRDESVCSMYHRAPDSVNFSGNTRFPPTADLSNLFRALRISRSTSQAGPNPDLDAIVGFAKGFRPDVIYCQPREVPRYYWWLPRYLGSVLDRPIVTHILDDWPTLVANRDRAEGREAWVGRLNACLNDLFRNSAANLGISDAMDRAYQERYGVSFEVMQNAIEIEEWQHVHKDNSVTNSTFKIIYNGGIQPYKQHRSLRDIGVVASRLTAKSMPVEVVVHSPEHLNDKYGQEVFSLPSVHYGGYLPRELFAQSLADADLLVVPVNFDEHSLSYIRYSMPAKVPEYMASGTPILVYAPAESPPAQYARDAGWGVVVDERDLDRLELQIATLINSQALREELGRRARSIALEYHSFDHVRARFRQVLASAATRRFFSVMTIFADLLAACKITLAPTSLARRLPEPVKKLIRSALGRVP